MFTPANIEKVEGPALSQEGKPQTHSDKMRDFNISVTSVSRMITYYLQLNYMLIHCTCSLPGSRLIVPVLAIILSGFQSTNV